MLGALVLLNAVSPAGSEPLRFGNVSRTTNEVTLELQGASNAAYFVERSNDLEQWKRVLVSSETNAQRTVILNDTNAAGFYRASTAVDRPRFTNAVLATGIIDLMGNNFLADSFDSRSEEFSTGGMYDPNKRKEGGHIASNGGIADSLNVGSLNIFGSVLVGPGKTVYFGPNGMVTGAIRDGMDTVLGPVAAPFTEGLPPLSGIVDGVMYDYVISTGDYLISEPLVFGGRVLVTGDARVLVTSRVEFRHASSPYSPYSSLLIRSNASLKLFVSGEIARFAGNGVANETGNAARFQYYGLPGNSMIDLKGHSSIIGVIYAPLADLRVLGGGAGAAFDFVGAMVVRNLLPSPFWYLHFDEALIDFQWDQP